MVCVMIYILSVFVRHATNVSEPNFQPLTVTSTASRTFQKIVLDILGPLELDADGYKYVLILCNVVYQNSLKHFP